MYPIVERCFSSVDSCVDGGVSPSVGGRFCPVPSPVKEDSTKKSTQVRHLLTDRESDNKTEYIIPTPLNRTLKGFVYFVRVVPVFSEIFCRCRPDDTSSR